MIIQGDCLDVMGHISDGWVDLIYADPPYNTGRDFGKFDDRWSSDEEYLGFIVARLREMHRILKPTGSLYLHCDPTMSHYLKVELDAVFGRANFRNEIIWCYTGPGRVTRWFQRKHDVVLFYARTDDATFNADSVRIPYVADYTAARGVHGAHKGQGSKKRHLQGRIPTDWWADPHLTNVSAWMKERTGYPTQKPLRLLDRIIKASSNKGDLVFDPFCGSGTTLVSAHRLGRWYIGCDIWDVAIRVAKERLAGV